jgi:TRAP-type C4-dicarboxylate transport system substrate-binding protein
VMTNTKFKSLSPAHQQALVETGRDAEKALTIAIRKDDEKAYKAILDRGVKSVSLAENMKAWDDVLKAARVELAKTLYPEALLKRVQDIATAAG